jgi:hypothetical protein
MADYTDDPAWKAFADHAKKEMLPLLAGSACTISLCPSDSEGDAKFWVELGASIMLDKPIIVVAEPGRVIPHRLSRVADDVIFADMANPADQQRLTERLALLMSELEDGDGR